MGMNLRPFGRTGLMISHVGRVDGIDTGVDGAREQQDSPRLQARWQVRL